jgi:hypothetical protein
MPRQWCAAASLTVWSWRDQPPDVRGNVDVEALDWRSQRMANDDLPRRCELTSHALLTKGLWLAVDKVIHHDDVMLLIIIRPRGDVAGRDPHPGDECIIKHNAEEG